MTVADASLPFGRMESRMPSRGRYRLHREIHAVVAIDGKPRIDSLPVGSIITVDELNPNGHIGMMVVSWGDRLVKLFAEDIDRRGVHIDA